MYVCLYEKQGILNVIYNKGNACIYFPSQNTTTLRVFPFIADEVYV